MLADTGNYEKARTLLEEIVQAHPDKTEAHVILVRVYTRLKLTQKARREMAIVKEQSNAQASVTHQ